MTDMVAEREVPVQVLRQASLTEEQAKVIYAQGRQAVVFALLELTQQLSEARSTSTTLSTPSGMVPVYENPVQRKRGKKPGAKQGHRDSRRQTPERIDRQQQ